LAWLGDSWKESYHLSLIWGFFCSALQLNARSFVAVALLTKKIITVLFLMGALLFPNGIHQHRWLSEEMPRVPMYGLLGTLNAGRQDVPMDFTRRPFCNGRSESSQHSV